MIRYSFLAIILLTLFSCNRENEGIKPHMGSITESVYATVVVLPDSLYRVHAAVGGLVESIFVEEGDTVQLNQPIMQISNTAPELNVRNAKLALELAEEEFEGKAAILKRIEDDIDVARLNMQQDSVDYMRQKRLRENNIGTEAEYDRRRLAYEVSRKTLARLQDELIRTRLQLETQLKQARNNYETTLSAAGDFTVESKINGKVYGLYKEPGEYVTFQEPVAAIGSAGNFLMEMRVDEVDIARLHIGQQVIVTLDAFEGDAFTGHISRILPQKDERTQTFTVEAVFDEPPASLYAGLSGEANIVISRKNKTITIPRSYLIEGNKVSTGEELVEVQTGLRSMEEVEILEGIDTSTLIYKPE